MYRRRRLVALGLVVVVFGAIVIGIAAGLGAFKSSPPPLTPAQIAALHTEHQLSAQRSIATLAQSGLSSDPPASGEAAPAPASPVFAQAAPAHDVFGYLPYWMLSTVAAPDFREVSTISYFAISLASDASLLQTDPGWADLSSSALADAISEAHTNGDKMLLTVTSASNGPIAALLAQPSTSASSLATQLSAIVHAHGFDGIDVDIEGQTGAERAAFVTFVTSFVSRFRALDPSGEIVLNTYPQSAGNSHDFFDIARLSPLVDQLFVMAYDMDNPAEGSSNDPLLAKSLGLSDVQSLLQYTRIVPRQKLVLGMPFYGYDFKTASSQRGAPVTGGPDAILYSSIASAGHQAQWDGVSATPYATYSVQGIWHQVWFDDPASIAIKTALAEDFRIGGVGTWALGFEGASTSMLDALDGGVAPLRSG